jgi:hypothetical protein
VEERERETEREEEKGRRKRKKKSVTKHHSTGVESTSVKESSDSRILSKDRFVIRREGFCGHGYKQSTVVIFGVTAFNVMTLGIMTLDITLKNCVNLFNKNVILIVRL